MKLMVVVIGFAVVAAVNVPGMVKEKLWKELLKYAAMFLVVFALAVLVALDVNVPSPIKGLMTFYRDVLHLSFKMS